MNKRMMIFVLMLMTAVGMQAQWESRWYGGEEIKRLMKEATGSDMNIVLNFINYGTHSTLNIEIPFKIKYEGMTMEGLIVVPGGSHKKRGSTVSTTFDKPVKLEYSDVQSDDPEMKSMLSDPSTKKKVLQMLKDSTMEQLGGEINNIKEVAEYFKTFDIESWTSTELVIKTEDQTFTFTREN